MKHWLCLIGKHQWRLMCKPHQKRKPHRWNLYCTRCGREVDYDLEPARHRRKWWRK